MQIYGLLLFGWHIKMNVDATSLRLSVPLVSRFSFVCVCVRVCNIAQSLR